MVIINQEKCIGCGQCIKDCVATNIQIIEGKAQVQRPCLQCGHCLTVCPANAVRISDYDMDDVEEYKKEDFTLDPNTFLRAIKYRRSIRSYQDKKVEKEKITQIAQAGRYTATAVNYQFHKFVFVQEQLEVFKEKVWDFVEVNKDKKDEKGNLIYAHYVGFNQRRKENPANDYLFRNAPAVVFVASDRMLDAGLAAQNMEMMAVSLGLGMLYNGFLARIVEANQELKEWMGIVDKEICACMLLGYPEIQYLRTAPRKELNFILK